MKRICLFFLLLCICIVSCAGQQQNVFAPFISRIKAESNQGVVRLTWEDSEDIDGTYGIYRYTDEITAATFEKAEKIAEVAGGVEYFVDHPPKANAYYYAVLARDNNKLYKLFIPFRNKTVSGVKVSETVTMEDLAASITNIHTDVREDSILVNFFSDKDDRELIMYRSTSPLRKKEDVRAATPLRIIPSDKESVRDFPVPGISYYYAVLDSALVKSGKIDFKPGSNTTIIPAKLTLGTRVGLPETTARRSLPLPLYPLSMDIETGNRMSGPDIFVPEQESRLSPATKKAVVSLLKSIEPQRPPKPEPDILSADTGAPQGGGEEYTLRTILESTFLKREWENAENRLLSFLSIHHSPSIEQRAHYYLGQVYYFQGKYRESFMEFLLAREEYYPHVDPWLDELFYILRYFNVV